jgi:outer membrane protein assembly factor BamB
MRCAPPALVPIVAAVVGVHLAFPADPPGDWPMWGGTPGRNLVSSMKGLPSAFDPGKMHNIRWVAFLGSQTYASPVVAGSVVYVGTNNARPRDARQAGDRGVLMAFRESDGRFLWQHTHQKLPSGKANDWPGVGVCSTPLVDGKYLYYVSNRCELVCLDTRGFSDGNDGPVTDEKLTGPTDADVVWKLDMIKEAGVYPHNMANSSPVSHGDLIFAGTSNGRDESHARIPAPAAPSLIAVHRRTGRLTWRDNTPGSRILHGQWSSPAVARIGDSVQVVVGQGDGWARGFDALTGRKLWEFDLNPKGSVWPGTRNEILGTPVVHQNIVYLANGQDPEHGDGPAHLYAIDATKRGDITATGRIWHYDKYRRSVSSAAIYRDLLFHADFRGFVYCLDARTGKPHWTYDTLGAIWGSPVVVDGKVYVGNEEGDVFVFVAAGGPAPKLLFKTNFGEGIYTTPTPANGALLVASRTRLWSISARK